MNHSRKENTLSFSKTESPLQSDLVAELATFWEDLFGVSYEKFRSVLAGSEQGLNRNFLYMARNGSKLVGTTQLTLSGLCPRLGGLGEVATAASHRRNGIGRRLCEQARDEFLDLGGEAILLGTVNPAAAQLYYRLGWRKLASTNVMCLVKGHRSPEEFFVEHFRGEREVSVAAGDAAQRIGMIPLLVCPHDGRILDANLHLFSTRYAVQSSCMSLFPRYEALCDRENGQWFAATTSDGCLVGLASARRRDANTVQVDGFSHRNFHDASRHLLMACVRWASDHGANRCLAQVASDEEERCDLFDSLDFSQAGDGQNVDMDGTIIPTISFTKDCAGTTS